MARKFDFEVITLDRTPVPEEHTYQWKCKHRHKERSPVAYSDIGCLLDEFGADGWNVVAATSDGRFGNQLILMREIPDQMPASESKAFLHAAAAPVPKEAGVTVALLAEVKALRETVEVQQLRQMPLAPQPSPPPFDPGVIQEGIREALAPFLHELLGVTERTRQEGVAGATCLHAQSLALVDVGTALTRFSAAIERQEAARSEQRSLWAWPTLSWRKWSHVLITAFSRLAISSVRSRAGREVELTSG